MPRKIDEYDRKIMEELDKNSRSSASAIAKSIKLPKETVNYRIKKLQEQKYIKYFFTLINASEFGYSYFRIYLGMLKTPPNVEKKLLSFLQNSKHCSNVRNTEGFFDIVFLTMHRNASSLRFFLSELLKEFGGYISTKNVHMIIKSYKLSHPLFSKTREMTILSHGIPNSTNLDELDFTILRIISTKARIPLLDIAKKSKQKPQTIKYHLNKLEKADVIAGYSTAFNADSFKRELIQVDITLKSIEQQIAMIEFFNNTQTCIAAYELLGKYDLSVELFVESDLQLRSILEKFRSKFLDYLVTYDVSHIFNDYVANWSPFRPSVKIKLDDEDITNSQ